MRGAAPPERGASRAEICQTFGVTILGKHVLIRWALVRRISLTVDDQWELIASAVFGLTQSVADDIECVPTTNGR